MKKYLFLLPVPVIASCSQLGKSNMDPDQSFPENKEEKILDATTHSGSNILKDLQSELKHPTSIEKFKELFNKEKLEEKELNQLLESAILYNSAPEIFELLLTKGANTNHSEGISKEQLYKRLKEAIKCDQDISIFNFLWSRLNLNETEIKDLVFEAACKNTNSEIFKILLVKLNNQGLIELVKRALLDTSISLRVLKLLLLPLLSDSLNPKEHIYNLSKWLIQNNNDNSFESGYIFLDKYKYLWSTSDLDETQFKDLLFEAAGNNITLKMLKTLFYKVKLQQHDIDSLLKLVVQNNGNVHVIDFLIDKGANPDLKNDEGDTLLHLTKQVKIAHILLSRDAKIEIYNNEGKTSFHSALTRLLDNLKKTDNEEEITNGVRIIWTFLIEGANQNLSSNQIKTLFDLVLEIGIYIEEHCIERLENWLDLIKKFLRDKNTNLDTNVPNTVLNCKDTAPRVFELIANKTKNFSKMKKKRFDEILTNNYARRIKK